MLRDLAAEAPTLPVAVLSASENPADVRTVLSAGALGFIPKSSRDEVIVSAIALVAQGRGLRSSADDAAAARSAGTDAPAQDVLALLSQGRSNKEIAGALGLSEATVKQHVSVILKALRASNRVQAVLAAGGGRGKPGAAEPVRAGRG